MNYRISNIRGHFLDAVVQDAALTKFDPHIIWADTYQVLSVVVGMKAINALRKSSQGIFAGLPGSAPVVGSLLD